VIRKRGIGMENKKKQFYYVTSPEIEVIPQYLENGELHSYIIQRKQPIIRDKPITK